MAATFTTYFNLAKPATGDLDWGPEVDGNFDIIANAMRASLEDRFLRFMGGGTLLYTASTGEVSFTEDIVIHHGVTGYVSTIPVSESPIVVSDAFRVVYANIERNPQANETISIGNGNLFNNQTAVPATNNAILLAIRDGVTPVNRVILPTGQILEDGLPGTIGGGTGTTLQRAYENSLDGVIEVDPAKPLLIRSEDVDTDSPIQVSTGHGADDKSDYPTPTFFAVQFTLSQSTDVSRLAFRLGKVGTPVGNWRYKILGNSSGLPNSADIKYTSGYTAVSTLAVVPASQYVAGAPTLVTLPAGTYWVVVEVDATYQGGVSVSNYITVGRATGSGLPTSATYNGVTTLWTVSGPSYYHEVYSTALGAGPVLVKLDGTGEGKATFPAPLETESDATHTLEFTGLKNLVAASLVSPDKIVLTGVEDMPSVQVGSDLYLRSTANPTAAGLYRIASVAVNTPSAGQTQITINTTSTLQNTGYKVAVATAALSGATADILKTDSVNRLFRVRDESLSVYFEVDTARGRAAFYKDVMLSGSRAILALLSTDSIAGSLVQHVQRELNGIASFTGRTLNGVYNELPVWTNNDVGSSTNNVKQRADALTERFNATTGHQHTGTDSPKVLAVNIDQVRLAGSLIRGVDINAITGTSTVVTSIMTGLTPSSGDTVKGVVVIAPNNKIIIRDKTTSDQVLSPAGDQVYGRLTHSAGVWTLSFYTDVAGTETAFSLTAQDIQWYYQRLYNPITDAPIYSQLASIPSDNATQDVIDASASQRGLMSASIQTLGGVKTWNAGQNMVAYLAIQRADVASTASIVQLASAKSFVNITGSTPTTVHGIAAGVNGQLVTVHNETTVDVTMKAASVTASAADRIDMVNDAIIPSKTSAEFIYNSTSSRWKLKSVSGSLGTVVTSTRGGPTVVGATGLTGIVFGAEQKRVIFVVGDGNAITANPQIPAGTFVGQECILFGTSDGLPVTFNHGTGLSLVSANIVLGNGTSARMMWDGSAWADIGRN